MHPELRSTQREDGIEKRSREASRFGREEHCNQRVMPAVGGRQGRLQHTGLHSKVQEKWKHSNSGISLLLFSLGSAIMTLLPV